MVDALSGMQPLLTRNADSFLGQVEDSERGFVGLCLLRRDDVIKFDFELAGGRREEGVVHVGDDGQPVTGFQLAKRGDGIWKRLPILDRGWKRIDLAVARCEV